MARVVLLGCPICDAVRTLEGTQTDHPPDNLQSVVRRHLHTHYFAEDNAAALTRRVASNAVEVIVPAADLGHLPLDEWRPHTDTGLSQNVVTRAVPETDAGPSTEPGFRTHSAHD